MTPLSLNTALPSAAQYQPPVEKLAASQTLTEEQKLERVSKSFEAMLLRQVLEEAQKPVFRSKLVNESATGSIYRDMVTTQMADSIAQSGTLGLSSILMEQMRRKEPVAPDAGTVPTEPTDKPKKLVSPKNLS